MREEPVERKGKDVEEIKRELQAVSQQIKNLRELQWTYSKRMLKFGAAAWIFGLSTFITALLIAREPILLLETPPSSISTLITGASAPVLITTARIQKPRRKIRRLERVKRDLFFQHKKARLRSLKNMLELKELAERSQTPISRTKKEKRSGRGFGFDATFCRPIPVLSGQRARRLASASAGRSLRLVRSSEPYSRKRRCTDRKRRVSPFLRRITTKATSALS